MRNLQKPQTEGVRNRQGTQPLSSPCNDGTGHKYLKTLIFYKLGYTKITFGEYGYRLLCLNAKICNIPELVACEEFCGLIREDFINLLNDFAEPVSCEEEFGYLPKSYQSLLCATVLDRKSSLCLMFSARV